MFSLKISPDTFIIMKMEGKNLRPMPTILKKMQLDVEVSPPAFVWDLQSIKLYTKRNI